MIIHLGLFQFGVVPFGLLNAGATLSAADGNCPGGVKWKNLFDDIIVFSRTQEQHLHELDAVCQKVHQAHLTLHVKKFHIFQTQLTFLGHAVSGEGVAVDPAKIEAITAYRAPTYLKSLQRFLW